MRDIVETKFDVLKVKKDLEAQLKHLEKWQTELTRQTTEFREFYQAAIKTMNNSNLKHHEMVETYLSRMNEILEKKL